MIQIQNAKNEKGQALVIVAASLFAIILIGLLVMQIRRVYQAVNFIEETAEAAVEIALRPLGSSLVTSDLAIDKIAAQQKIKEDLTRSVGFASKDFDLTAEDVLDDMEIEIINPPADSCTFIDESQPCYESPAVKVKITVVLSILGMKRFQFSRSARGTLGALAGSQENRPVIPEPTKIILPTEVFVVTKTP